MKKTVMLMLCTVIALMSATAQKNFYDFSAKDQNGEEVKMSNYEGKVILLVNTATQCGFTPQYKWLEEIYLKYQEKGFVILDFPCNQFGEQAPGSDIEIHKFCTERYNTTFPQFAKTDVNGDAAHPLFTWLKKQKGFAGFNLKDPIGKYLDEAFSKEDPNYRENPDIKWNFTKFLIDQNGNVVERFEPTAGMEEVLSAIEKLIFNGLR